MKLKHEMVKKGNKLHLCDQEKYNKDIAKIKEGEHVYLVINKASTGRSAEQNAYYWGVVLDLIYQETGQEAKDLHTQFRNEFLSVQNHHGDRFVMSTASLSTIEFEKYLAHIRQFAATELSICVPLPNDSDIPETYRSYE